jgi:hypothetical protein
MAFSVDTIRQGQNIGMLPSPLDRLRQSPEFKMFSPQEQKDLIKDALKGEYELDATRSALEGMNRPYYDLSQLGEFREQEARRAQELGKESLKEAFKYGMLANIPKTISQSFGNIAAMNLAAGQGVADTYSRTLAAYPRAQFSTFNFQPQKYFE